MGEADGLVVHIEPALAPEFDATAMANPDPVLNCFVWEGRHREAGVRKADPVFLVAHDGEGGVETLAMKLVEALGSGPGFLDSVTQDELVDLPHRHPPVSRDVHSRCC